jgi:hypothetical protein
LGGDDDTADNPPVSLAASNHSTISLFEEPYIELATPLLRAAKSKLAHQLLRET